MRQIFQRAGGDTWELVIGQTGWTIMIAVAVFLVAIFLAHRIRGREFAQDWIAETLIGLVAVIIVGVCVFLVEFFLIVPSQLITEKDDTVTHLTKQVNGLQSDNDVLVGQTNALQKQVDKDDAALSAVAAVTGYTNRAFAQNAEDILSTLNDIQSDVKKVKDRIYAKARSETYHLNDTNSVTVLSSTNQGPIIFFRLNHFPIQQTIEGVLQGPQQQTPLILEGIYKNVVWVQFPDLGGLNLGSFTFTYYIDPSETNLISKVTTANGHFYFDGVCEYFSIPEN